MSAASKLFAAVSGTALLLAVAYAMSAQGSVPITLLVALASAAAVAVVVTTAVGGRDLAPAGPLDAPPPESRSITAGAPARPSMWPPVVAAGIGLVAVGAAVGMGWLVATLVVVTALALGGAGLASGLKGERSYDLVAPPPSAQLLVAHNTAFAQTQLN